MKVLILVHLVESCQCFKKYFSVLRQVTLLSLEF